MQNTFFLFFSNEIFSNSVTVADYGEYYKGGLD